MKQITIVTVAGQLVLRYEDDMGDGLLAFVITLKDARRLSEWLAIASSGRFVDTTIRLGEQ
jgi:hypothetical protein